MIILFWIIGILAISIIVGEIRFRQPGIRKRGKKLIVKDWKDNIDTDIDSLYVEKATSDFVPATTLAMRGSWRLAQNSVMNSTDFSVLKATEYSKNLQ